MMQEGERIIFLQRGFLRKRFVLFGLKKGEKSKGVAFGVWENYLLPQEKESIPLTEGEAARERETY